VASPNPAGAHAIPGRLVCNPTQEPATGTFPFGGTELGTFDAFALLPAGVPFVIEDEASGAPDEVLEPNDRWALGFELQGADSDALELLFRNNAEAASRTRHARFDAPGAALPGKTAGNRSVRLLLVPNAEAHRGLLVYAGVAFLADGGRIAFSRRERHTVPVAVVCLPDSTARIVRWARLRDLRL